MENIKVYEAICKITDGLTKEGIKKGRKNQQQGFAYRGIDDVYMALAPLLSEHSLCILPKMLNKTVSERASKSGGTLFYTMVDVEYDLVSSIDGSKHTVSSYGEAMDSGDKSVGKAMSYAYKAMAFQTFCIPTEGDNDPDARTHEVLPKVAIATPPGFNPPDVPVEKSSDELPFEDDRVNIEITKDVVNKTTGEILASAGDTLCQFPSRKIDPKTNKPYPVRVVKEPAGNFKGVVKEGDKARWLSEAEFDLIAGSQK